jgi:hypothetical protein
MFCVAAQMRKLARKFGEMDPRVWIPDASAIDLSHR